MTFTPLKGVKGEVIVSLLFWIEPPNVQSIGDLLLED
jgi:hypothetical protein